MPFPIVKNSTKYRMYMLERKKIQSSNLFLFLDQTFRKIHGDIFLSHFLQIPLGRARRVFKTLFYAPQENDDELEKIKLKKTDYIQDFILFLHNFEVYTARNYWPTSPSLLLRTTFLRWFYSLLALYISDLPIPLHILGGELNKPYTFYAAHFNSLYLQ